MLRLRPHDDDDGDGDNDDDVVAILGKNSSCFCFLKTLFSGRANAGSFVVASSSSFTTLPFPTRGSLMLFSVIMPKLTISKLRLVSTTTAMGWPVETTIRVPRRKDEVTFW